jgi:hypothetical protein
MWTPINKKTKMRYPAITDEEKAVWLQDKHIATRYVFEKIGPSEVGELFVLPGITIERTATNSADAIAIGEIVEANTIWQISEAKDATISFGPAAALKEDTCTEGMTAHIVPEDIPEPIEAKKKPKSKE